MCDAQKRILKNQEVIMAAIQWRIDNPKLGKAIQETKDFRERNKW